MLNRQGRPTRRRSGRGGAETFSGNRGLAIEEPLIFEIGRTDTTGVDLQEPAKFSARLGKLARTEPLGLPGLSEPEAMRHFVRLSQKNYGIDTGIFPLGSCTMKHNPRLNEKMARLPGFGDIHPLQPLSTVPGAIELIAELSRWLSRADRHAGGRHDAQGRRARRAVRHDGDQGGARGAGREALRGAGGRSRRTAPTRRRRRCSAIASRRCRRAQDGTVDPEEVRKRLSPDVAAIMLTNPNTCGLFERDVVAIADAVHAAGAYFYADGANFNAIVGKVRPGDLGVDAMHINLHKTFSTPHGGGGPGAGPVALSAALAPFMPVPYVVADAGGVRLRGARGRVIRRCATLGAHVCVPRADGHVRAGMAYMLSHGSDGMRQASEDAVLNANYVRASLSDLMSLPYGDRACMHEVLFDDHWLEGTGITTLDFAKAMIDEGFHPMTVYFPLVVHGAMLIEPTESESKQSLDQFIGSLRGLAQAAKPPQAAQRRAALQGCTALRAAAPSG